MPTTTEFVCDRCSKCCEVHRVPVTAHDLMRLEEAPELGGKAVGEFVELASPETLDLQGEPESLARVSEGSGFLVLRHQAGGCVFLERGQGCRVHRHRPAACRAYPFERPEGGARSLSLHTHRLCPPETIQPRDESLPQGEAVESFRQAVVLRDQEASAHATTLQSWNRRQRVRLRMAKLPQSKERLLSFLCTPPSDT